MNAPWHSRTTLFNKLRINHSRLDGDAAKRRMMQALASVDLTPLSLSPSAILVIRKLSDPLPRALKFQPLDSEVPRAWQQATSAAIEQLANRAYRPILGGVPADAEAVIFLDRAELLACLAKDWCANNLTLHWWWPSLFKLTDIKQLIFNEWLKAPQFAPAGLAKLAEIRQVKAFVRKFTDDEIVILLQAIIHTFGLLEIQSALKTDGWRNGRFQGEASAATKELLSSNARLVPERVALLANWRSDVQEDLSGTVGQSLLCVIGLTLARAPAAARSTHFAKALAHWLQPTTALAKAPEAIKEIAKPHLKTAGESVDARATTQTAEPVTASVQLTATGPNAIDGEPIFDLPHQHTDNPKAIKKNQPLNLAPQQLEIADGRLSQNPSNTPALTSREDWPANSEARLTAEAPTRQSEADGGQPQAHSSRERSFEAGFDAVTKTALGGLFYLINLGLFLNLYGDFTSPMRPGIGLSIWDFLALVGERLYGAPIKHDAVWRLLATLAERHESEEPGQDFFPSEQWRVPVDWLKPFENQAVWYAADNRLRVVHAEGFAILDVEMVGPTALQLAEEMESYGGSEPFRLQPAAIFPVAQKLSPLEQWLAWLMPYLRRRLARAIGINDETELAKVLLQHEARAQVGPMRLEVFFDLKQLPIEVRYAGLDRNPGWVPAAGRFIEFHFD